MTCKSMRPLLMDFCSRRLSAAEAATVASHLKNCADCRRIADDERLLRGWLQAVPSVAPRRELWTQVAALRDATAERRPGVMARLGAWLTPQPRALRFALAPALVTLAAATLLLSPSRRPTDGAAEAVAVMWQAQDISDQSDDPLAEFSERTWDALDSGTGRS